MYIWVAGPLIKTNGWCIYPLRTTTTIYLSRNALMLCWRVCRLWDSDGKQHLSLLWCRFIQVHANVYGRTINQSRVKRTTHAPIITDPAAGSGTDTTTVTGSGTSDGRTEQARTVMIIDTSVNRALNAIIPGIMASVQVSVMQGSSGNQLINPTPSLPIFRLVVA